MINLSLRLRVIVVVALAYITVFGVLGVLSMQNSRGHLLQSEHEKLTVILETLAPTLSINMQMGLLGALGQPLEELHQHNRDLLASRIVDQTGNVLFVHGIDQSWVDRLDTPKSNTIYSRIALHPPFESDVALGYLEAIYSPRHYEKMLRDHTRLGWQLGALFFIALAAIALYMAYAFLPLKRLAEAMGRYRPDANRADLSAIKGDGELATIVKAAEEMMERISRYTRRLEQLNATLEEKVAAKTESLEQLNATLEARVAKEVEKNRQQERLMFQQAKQAQMGEMISMIAHQWRQPLSAIGTLSGNIRLQLQLGQGDPATLIELLGRIDSHVQHLSSTVNDFRNLFNPNRQMEPVDLEQIIQRALDILSSTFSRHRIATQKSIEHNQPVYTYPNEILQSVLGILKNAADVLIEREIAAPCVMIALDAKEGGAVLSIGDNAGGVPPELTERIFEPYFSTKDAKNGTGLGLYMAKTLIEQHCQGQLRLENSALGARFIITLSHEGERLDT